MKWLLALILVVALSAGAAVFLLDIKMDKPAPSEQAGQQGEFAALEEGPVQRGEGEISGSAAAPAPVSLEKKFEDFLNSFLNSVNSQVKDYKSQRKILAEAVSPVNIRSEAYVEENYKLMQGTAQELRLKMERLMQTFSEAQSQVEAMLLEQPEETRETILLEWEKMQEKQVSHYIEFFQAEEEIIKVYEQLMQFYYQEASSFKVDPINNRIVFENLEDEVKNLAFLKTIEDLEKKEGKAVNSK